MYLPKNRYNLLSTPDTKVIDEAGVEYTGPVVKTYKNERFKGSNILEAEERLFPVEEIDSFLFEEPYNDYFEPTTEDYKKGEYTRYILFDKRRKLFKEVNYENYSRFRRLEFVEYFSLLWQLRQPADDTFINGYFLKGSSTRNTEAITELNNTYPGLVDFLNPYQYIREN